MTRLPVLLLLPLAACAVPAERGGEPLGLPALFGSAPPEAPQPEPLPPTVAAALPPGVPPSVVLQDAAGCYLYSIERTDPPSGYPLRDAAGNQICEGGAPPVLAAAAPGAPPPGAAPPPAETAIEPAAEPVTEPATEPAAGAIDITPVLEAPLPADAPDAPDAPALTPGTITPPAPIVQPD